MNANYIGDIGVDIEALIHEREEIRGHDQVIFDHDDPLRAVQHMADPRDDRCRQPDIPRLLNHGDPRESVNLPCEFTNFQD